MLKNSIPLPARSALFLFGLLTFVAGATSANVNFAKEQIRIKGEAVGIKNSDKVYLQRYQNKMFFVIDSAVVKDGNFTFNHKLDIPELYGVSAEPGELSTLFVFIDTKNELAIHLDTARGGRNSTISGSPAADRYKLYQQNARNTNIEAFIKEQPASIVSAFVLYRYFSPSLSADEVVKYTNLLDPSLSGTQYVKLLRELPASLRSTAIGEKAPDFELPNPEGKLVKLSDHFGKYLLVDFWAAWCGPCRRENPNIVRVFNKYKDKGFSVFGVSLDSKKDAWIQAIQKDGLNWPQVSDLLFWDSGPAKLYGIRGIPGNVLLDPTGKIIARNLRGEDLEKKLAELIH
ncbi:TlpA disulfide reductase family protein [Paraflavitalea pollutisoli]|uniref:TlpA disulfide reductase family protein n=1 Tax=Paraflavitalea pollutisoli TaxID=3034143 RepID=UPI0023ED75C7|nr:TlpA disulfide reductase family protein [Paraflavitalea sp. H1-2-19X]